MDPLLRVAADVRLRATRSGLRAEVTDVADVADVTDGAPVPETPGRAGVVELEERARHARAVGDDDGLRAVEQALGSLHLLDVGPLTYAGRPVPLERAALRDVALRAATAPVSPLRPVARARARAAGVAEADAYAGALDTGHAAVAQHRQAVHDDVGRRLARHDPATVVGVLDAAFAEVGHGCTCVDAGREDDSGRAHVTVVGRHPGLEVVADRDRDASPDGLPVLRQRTHLQRNAVHLGCLASYVLAVARQALAVAVAVDDVHVVVLRAASGGSMSDPVLEAVYVGCVSREAVQLRDPEADPVPLLLGSAVRPLRFTPDVHDLEPLEPEPDVDAIVRACVAALGEPAELR